MYGSLLNSNESSYCFVSMSLKTKLPSLIFSWLQCWPKETLQVLFYEAKAPTLEGYSTIQECGYVIGYHLHKYHTSALSNEVCNFV